MISANTVKPMILLNTSSSIVRDLKVSGNVWSSTFFLKTERKIIIDEKVALFGVLGCNLYESKGTTANNIKMVLLVAKMCISKVKYGIARSPMVVFETQMAVREKYLN